jgi:hypothetical protein
MKKALKLLRTLIELLGRLTGILGLLEHMRRRQESTDGPKDEPDTDEPANGIG